jgi:LCP family protein required for cell wall assembly
VAATIGARMASGKTYRRVRVRGTSEDGGLDALRRLNREAAGEPVAPPARRPASLEPGRGERRRRERAARAPGAWWNPVGRGVGGWAWRVGAVLLVGLVVWAGAGLLVLNGAVADANDRVTPGARAALDDPGGGMLGTPHNTLIIGADALPGQTRSRADSIMVMRTDPEAGKIKYLSIPRDYRVELPRVGPAKINAAFRFFGQQGMIRAVKRLTGVPIHHVIVIKFNGFERLVGELGGVTVNNPVALTDCPYPGGRRVSFPKGEIDLDSEEALVFARVRSCDSDFSRSLRQQALVAGLKQRVLAPSSIWRAPWRGAKVVDTMNTDIGTFDMVKFGWLQARLDQDPADRILLSGETLTIDGASFVVSQDPERNEEEIRRFVASS